MCEGNNKGMFFVTSTFEDGQCEMLRIIQTFRQTMQLPSSGCVMVGPFSKPYIWHAVCGELGLTVMIIGVEEHFTEKISSYISLSLEVSEMLIQRNVALRMYNTVSQNSIENRHFTVSADQNKNTIVPLVSACHSERQLQTDLKT